MKQRITKNLTKGSIIRNLPYAISFLFLCLTVAGASFKSLGISCVIGLFFGIGCILLDVHQNVVSKLGSIEKKICIVISIIGAVLLSFVFYSTWQPSSKIKSLLGLISGNTDLLLRVGSIFLALFSTAAIFILIAALVKFFVLLSHNKMMRKYAVVFIISAGVACVCMAALKNASSKANIIMFLVFVLLLICIEKRPLFNPIYKVPSLCLGFLYAICTVIGVRIHHNGSIFAHLLSINFLIELIGLTFLFTIVVNFLITKVMGHQYLENRVLFSFPEKRIFGYSWLIIFICWLPYYVAYCPGVLSPDSISEIGQQIGVYTLSNHHPIIHQLMIKPFMLIGQLVNNLHVGVALYSLFQMILLSCCFALAILLLSKLKVSQKWLIVVIAFFALCPINAMYSITMWKDIMMGGFALISLILLYMIHFDEEKKIKRIWAYPAVFLALFLFCTFRNNGFYAFCIFVPFYLILNRKRFLVKKTVLVIAVIASVLCYQYCLFNVLGISKSSSGEALSVPLQQIARTVRDHSDEITDEEFDILDEIFADARSIGDLYTPTISDPIKSGKVFKSDNFNQNPSKYLRLWFKLFLRCPSTYINAFVAQCYGYWFPDVSYWVTSSGIYQSENIQLNQADLMPLLNKVLNKAQSLFQKIPGFSAFYSIAFYAWVILFSIGVLVVKKRFELLSPIILIVCLWFTTLASPVFCEFRYLYGMVTTAPVILTIAVSAKSRLLGLDKMR